MHAPSTRTLVVAAKDGSFNVVHDQDLPPLDDCSILVKTEAMAINPSDTKMLGAFQTPGAVLGTDFAGTVVAVGPKAKAGIAIGNRVCGASHGMNAHRPQHGAFASYVSTENDVWLRIPEGMSVEEGASLPAGLCTIGLALRALGLPTPDNPAQKPIKVLVYGGSTASGTLALQLLRLSNVIPITTCSPKNFELVRKYGAEVAFDYRTPTCALDIRDYTKNGLFYALDCITTVESTACCYGAIGRAGGKYVSLDPFDVDVTIKRTAIEPSWVLGPTIFGHDISWPAPYDQPGKPEVAAFASEYFAMLQRLLDAGKLRTHPLRILTGGMEKVLEGMDVLKSGTISGEKIVIKLSAG